MPKELIINQEDFEKFLSLLDKNREIAGQKYEAIRVVLIRFFYSRGFYYTAEDLADESIDRAIKKIGEIADKYEGNPALYCYGVAKKVGLEYRRKPKTEELPEIIVQIDKDITETETDYRCLNKCLNELKPEQRMLIIRYHVSERQDKIKRRKEIERELKITNETLRIRIFRIKKLLQDCIRNCNKQEIE